MFTVNFIQCKPISRQITNNRIRDGCGSGAGLFGGPEGRLIPLPGGAEGVCPLGATAKRRGGGTAVGVVFGSSLNEVKTKKPGRHLTIGLPKTAATYSPNWWVSTIGDGELNFSVRNG